MAIQEQPATSPQRSRTRLWLWGLTWIAGLGLVGLFASGPVVCWRIRSLLADARLPEARALANWLAKWQPGSGEPQYLLAKAARRSGDFALAARALQRASSMGWDDEDIGRERTLAVAQSGQVRQVERELQRIFSSTLSQAETEEVYEALAYGHLSAFDGPELLKCLEYWRSWNPDAVQPRLMRADFLAQIGNHAAALSEYESLVRDHEEFVPGRLGLGKCLLALNRPADAKLHLQYSLAQERTAQAALHLAMCLVQTGESETARSLLEDFQATHDPEIQAQILEQLGRWHLDHGDAPQAVELLKQAVAASPQTSTAWHSLAGAYTMLGDVKLAEQAATTSRETEQRCLRLVEVVTQIAAEPGNLELRIEAARILFAQKLDEDAVRWLQTVLNVDPRQAQAHSLLADHYAASGQTELAARHRQNSIELLQPSQ